MNIQNKYFILLLVVLISIVFILKFLKIKKEYKAKSLEIQKKIEEIKTKNFVLQKKKNIEYFDSKKMHLITRQFLSVHNLILKKHLK